MIRRAACAALLLTGMAGGAAGFGENKVRYREFPWSVMHTEHFEVFYYPEEASLATEVCETAEQAWQSHTEYFRLIRAPQRKVPIFLFATFHEFIQNNVSPEVLDEGVGGFTEVFKTRVVLPLGPSKEQRRAVIWHELTHAQQFFILYGEGLRSYSLYKSVLVPQWFMEGMAEHCANDWDPQGEMVLRDAVLNDRLPPLTLLHSFNHLEPHDGYLGYKAGQSACDYLGTMYGEDKIPAILKGIEEAKTFAQVFQDKTGVSLTEFDRKWHIWLREKFYAQTKGRKDASDYGPVLVAGPSNGTQHNTAPVPSPVGDSIAFFSDRRGYRNLFLIDKGGSPSAVFGNAKFDAVTASAPDWSPDGTRLVVTVQDGPRNAFVIVTKRWGSVRKKLTFPFLDIGQPRFSPDGQSLAFVGFNGRSSEVYLASIATGIWRQLTFDGSAASSPAFTPDGKRLVYAVEGDGGNHLRVIDDITSPHPVSRSLIAGHEIKGGHPDVSPDGLRVLFDSAENGIPNLYVAAMDGSEIRQVTDARTGLYGARWARDGKRIVATTMEHGCQTIYMLTDVTRDAPLAMGFEAKPAGAPGSPASAPAGPGHALPDERALPLPPGAIPRSKLAPPRKQFTLGDTVASGPVRDHPHVLAIGGLAGLLQGAQAFAAPEAVRTARAGVSSTGLAEVTAASPAVPPPAPLALTAWREGADIVLSWSATGSLLHISRYEVFRSTGPGGEGRLLAMLYDPGATLYRDNTWQYAEPYSYRVRAITWGDHPRGAGEVAYTARVDVWTAPYKFSLESRLVDLFVLVGSVTIGQGTSFAGYGALQLSDLPGNHRLSIEANAFPSFNSLYGITYEYSGLRPDLAFSVMSQTSHFILYPSMTSTEHRDYPPSVAGSGGAEASMAYPLDKYVRIETSLSFEQLTEVFTDRYGDTIGNPKYSLIAPVSANIVRDTSRWNRLLPIGGSQMSAGISQSLPLAPQILRFTEYNGVLQWYQGLFDDSTIAVRWLGILSEGHDKRYTYFGGHYFLRAFPYASQSGNAVLLGNHELRMNLLKHLNINVPLIPLLFTDVQGVGFFDVGSGFDASHPITTDQFRPASIGGGINLIGFILQSSPVMVSIEVARRIDQHQTRPTVYGRLGPVF